jgi:putative restriction endonuclease
MTAAELIEKFRKVTMWKRGGVRAPHKPLLILLALGRVAQNKPRLMRFSEIEKPLRQLLMDFGPRRQSYHPEYPFWYLCNNKIWEVERAGQMSLKKNHREPRIEDMRDGNGGFLPDVYRLLENHPGVLKEAASDILKANFPDSLHDDILGAVGLSLEETKSKGGKRDPDFRTLVVRAYQHRCAICGFDVRLGVVDLGLEAAHIQWHQAGGPDKIENGLCLCSMHHHLFDRGALAFTNERQLLVSEEVHGTSGLDEWLFRFEGQIINKPQRESYLPKLEFLHWHRTEVFKSPARETPTAVG